ncbi:hypothetical protein [Methylorubrum thiocyanatum]|uniref:hypothetical protein n=1 Tax=Methylorubrum thiocyanatum TaxID=47958 RepID=UPI003F7F7CED
MDTELLRQGGAARRCQPGGRGGATIWLSHYAHRIWYRIHRGDLHLYGHSHGTIPDAPEGMSTDVGVGRWNWRPVTLEKILARLGIVAAGGEA